MRLTKDYVLRYEVIERLADAVLSAAESADVDVNVLEMSDLRQISVSHLDDGAPSEHYHLLINSGFEADDFLFARKSCSTELFRVQDCVIVSKHSVIHGVIRSPD